MLLPEKEYISCSSLFKNITQRMLGRGHGSQIDSESVPPSSFLRGLGSAAGSEAPAVAETDSYKELVSLLSTLRKKKAALSRLEDSLGTWKSRGLDLGLELLDRVTSAQGSTRDQLDSVREFLNSASKARVYEYTRFCAGMSG